MLEAVVLAGGFGMRLKQVVPDMPKPMAPIIGRPFLEILLTSLANKGFSRVVLSLGFMAEKVVTHFGDHFAGMELVYEIENTPLGTGGALRQALGRCNANHVFIFNGDTYLDLEVSKVEAFWQKHFEPIIIARMEPDTSRYGKLNTRDGRVIGFSEKGTVGSGLINAGCYVLPITILNEYAQGQPFSLELDFLTKAVNKLSFNVFITNGLFIDIGVPEDYARAQIELSGFI